ncbi:MAG: sulfotransferase [Alphaproteobacteria bacterium]|nr:sulfotransferase [Alphaproteobacteria bacterium]
MYKNKFIEKSHRYSNDLRELGAYYGMYSNMMDHWQSLFPGKIIDLNYDELVTNPEHNTRQLISAQFA